MSMDVTHSNFDALIQHWGKARLDTPLNLIGRLDDAARQLISAGAIIQASYVAAFGFGNLKATVPTWGVALLFAPLILMIYCAATVICRMPEHLEAHPTFELFKQMSSGIDGAKLDGQMKEWCEDIEKLTRTKRWWLHAANLSFILASAVTFGVLGWFVMSNVRIG